MHHLKFKINVHETLEQESTNCGMAGLKIILIMKTFRPNIIIILASKSNTIIYVLYI